MSRRFYLIIGLLVMISVTIGALMLFARYNRHRQRARFTIQTQAEIIGVNLTTYRTANASRERTDTVVDEQAGKRRTTTHVRYAYEANGARYENEIFLRGDKRENYRPGASVKVCVDPAHPFESVMIDADESCAK